MENNLAEKFAHIKGWGIDADPKNEPTYPMKNYTGDDHKRSNWERPTLQNPDFEVLKSTERPTLSAVVGDAPAPSGVSGLIRRYAYTFSENRLRHWLLLIAADRVNVVEGLVSDLISGHVPNIPKEKGIGADWEHNRTSLFVRAALSTAVIAGAGALIYYYSQNNGSSEERESRSSRSNNSGRNKRSTGGNSGRKTNGKRASRERE
ncbi:MAG: hypothetical protein ACXWEY_06665 [Bacteroidia bacterium]